MKIIRTVYRALSWIWPVRALLRGGPVELIKQRIRAGTHRELARALRRTPLRASRGSR